jgi:hypothetical protein
MQVYTSVIIKDMNNGLNPDEVQNLIGWLQEILKETQVTRGATLEMRDKVNLISGIKDQVNQPTGTTDNSERKIDETRSVMEAKLSHIEAVLGDMKNILNDMRSKIDKMR